MKICVPVTDQNELKSSVSEHFGSAAAFALIDTENDKVEFIENSNQHHSHGMCQPLATLEGKVFDIIIVGGIGVGAVNKLNAAGKKVMKSTAKDLAGIREAYNDGQLTEVNAQNACTSHSHD